MIILNKKNSCRANRALKTFTTHVEMEDVRHLSKPIPLTGLEAGTKWLRRKDEIFNQESFLPSANSFNTKNHG
jgi:hypothetical protein